MISPATLVAIWTFAKKFWPFLTVGFVALLLAVQTIRLHHAKASLAACQAERNIENAAVARLEAQARADTAAAQAAIDRATKNESSAARSAASILKPRPGSPTDCATARAVILDAIGRKP
ncbi:MAG: hypothetical protein JOZ27_02160 [Caulobacteraceae bacterium]|nr:hypothetical protein [Caulobacteraceae bacterium]